MAQLVDLYNIEAHKLHPIERAAKVHADFAGIHPFFDGNGRYLAPFDESRIA